MVQAILRGEKKQTRRNACGCLFDTLNSLRAGDYGDERFVKKLKGHSFSLYLEYVKARDSCDDNTAAATIERECEEART